MMSISGLGRRIAVLGTAFILAGCATQQAPAPYTPQAVAPYEAPARVEAVPEYEAAPRVYRPAAVVYVPRPYYYVRDPFFYGPVFGASVLSNWSYDFHRRTHFAKRKHARHEARKKQRSEALSREERRARRQARREARLANGEELPLKRRGGKDKKKAK